ncbi:carboxypeptidase-like regulatory domain-containing protein [Lewinella sp. IMCC34191]|uniref:carboxypeptidase-like regulatory domain-containing protein n=1 Tax=Lewinella sp. IMCC34191 TaxID=2259172 RepID=UPI000E259A09|nr:carboxypeptidase-like regulatory domain-containing protein [Lewinella sp. IMCC34191]
MLPNEYRDQELLHRWISGAITAPEEAELERRARTDPELREALAGLEEYPAEDHAAHVRSMNGRVKPSASRRSLFSRYAAAASILVLLGIAILVLPRYFGEPDAPVAMERESPAPSPTPKSTLPAPPPPSPAAEADEAVTASRKVTPESEPEPAAKEEVVEEEVLMDDMEDVQESAAEGAPAPQARRATTAPVLPPPRPLGNRAVRSRVAAAPAPQTVSGRVTDADGEPIANAEVRRLGLPLGTTTDSLGNFSLPADVTLNQIEVIHPDYEEETVEVFDTSALLQISLNEVTRRARSELWMETASVVNVPLDDDLTTRPEARPEDGYRQLRNRIEADRPDGLPPGKVRVSFLVHPDGSLSDFRFRGQPDKATMDYVGNALVESSTWQVVKPDSGEGTPDPIAPVRVYFTLRFE